MRTSLKTDFRSRDIAKNNFRGIDISQGLDLEAPSLSPYFLSVLLLKLKPPYKQRFSSKNSQQSKGS